MTHVDKSARQRESLYFGRIFGDTLSIFTNQFISLIRLAFVPALAIETVSDRIITSWVDGAGSPAEAGLALAGLFVLLISANAIVTALVIRLAYDANLGQAIRIRDYVSSAAAVAWPLIVCSLLAGIMFVVGLALLIIPGLYISALLWCLTPAIVVERKGFAAFGRSAELTRGYRWPCVGAVTVLFIGIILVSYSADRMAESLHLMNISAAATLLYALVSGATMSFSGIMTALVYARLREIKEGTSLNDLAEIFA